MLDIFAKQKSKNPSGLTLNIVLHGNARHFAKQKNKSHGLAPQHSLAWQC